MALLARRHDGRVHRKAMSLRWRASANDRQALSPPMAKGVREVLKRWLDEHAHENARELRRNDFPSPLQELS